MLGEKIKSLRTENSLTQKDLAEKLFVTAQAVSRWENNEVEPSITTLTAMAKIFNISVSELLGEEGQEAQQTASATKVEAPKPILALCEQCNKPIYNSSDIVRKTVGLNKVVLCKACNTKNIKKEYQTKVFYGIQQRNRSFIWGGIIAGLITIVLLIASLSAKLGAGMVATYTLMGAFTFPMLSCLFLKNNFVIDIFDTFADWTIKFPGLIFTLDLDGIVWLLTVKLCFWILGILVGLLGWILAISLGYAISLFVYPFALYKSFKYPERVELY